MRDILLDWRSRCEVFFLDEVVTYNYDESFNFLSMHYSVSSHNIVGAARAVFFSVEFMKHIYKGIRIKNKKIWLNHVERIHPFTN